MVYNRLHGKAPQYLMDCCIPISDVASRRHLSSASRHHLVVPRHNLSTYGRRAFAVAGSAAWNSLSDDVHDLAFSLTVSVICLRLVCFQSTNGYYTSCHSCAVQFHDLLTYLLTRPHVTATLILEMLKVTPSRYPQSCWYWPMDPNHINCVFSCKRLEVHQSPIAVTHRCKRSMVDGTLEILVELISWVSSAYRWYLSW